MNQPGKDLFHLSSLSPNSPKFQPVFRIQIRIHRIHMFLDLPDPDPLVRGNNVNVPSKSNKHKNVFLQLVFFLESWRSMTKIAGSRSASRLHKSEAWIRGSGSGSTPKCHGSGTLVSTVSRGHPSPVSLAVGYLAQGSGGCVPLGPARPVLGEVLELRDAGQLRDPVLPLLSLVTSQPPLLLTPHVRQQVCNMGDGHSYSGKIREQESYWLA